MKDCKNDAWMGENSGSWEKVYTLWAEMYFGAENYVLMYLYSTPASYYRELLLSQESLVKQISFFFANNTIGDPRA